jgi:hypothetical protein
MTSFSDRRRPHRFNTFFSEEEASMLAEISEALGLTASATIRTMIREWHTELYAKRTNKKART